MKLLSGVKIKRRGREMKVYKNRPTERVEIMSTDCSYMKPLVVYYVVSNFCVMRI